MKLKICYIANIQNIHTQRWVKYFAQKGHEIHVVSAITDSQSDYSHLKSVIIHPLNRLSKKSQENKRLGNSLPDKDSFLRIVWHKFYAILPKSLGHFLTFYVLYLWRAKKLIKVIKPDIVHGHFLTHYGFLAAMTGFHPLVISAWGSDVFTIPLNSFISKMMVKVSLGRADIITSNGKHLTDKMVEFNEKIMKKIVAFPWGIDPSIFYPRQNQKSKEDQQCIIFCSRKLEPVYNIESFLMAVPYIIEKIPKVRILIKGNGSQRAAIEGLVRELRLEPYINFLDWLKVKELACYYRISDIYVSTSLSDSTSVSLLEAMASGTFPIVSDIPGNREWIKDRENGFLVPTDDPKILAEKTIAAFNNRALRDSAAKKNIEIIKKEALWENNVGKMERHYFSLLPKNKQ